MGNLSDIIPLSKEEVEVYIQYDFKFFTDKILQRQRNITDDKKQLIEQGYLEAKNKLKQEITRNKKQALLDVDGGIRKMHSGGLLPSLFNLSEAREVDIIDFKAQGESQAYFEIWKKYKKREILKAKLWDIIIKIGAILGFISTGWQLFKLFNSSDC